MYLLNYTFTICVFIFLYIPNLVLILLSNNSIVSTFVYRICFVSDQSHMMLSAPRRQHRSWKYHKCQYTHGASLVVSDV